jgi:hypothetical protein
MKFLGGIRNWGALRALRKRKSEKRMRQVVNFHRAQKVGIIFESTGEHFFVLVKQYVQYLKETHGIRQVMAMGYVDDVEEPFYHRHQLNFDYFTRKDLNWWGIPSCDQSTNFCETEFDILIDFTKNDCLPLRFVMQDSKAKFKVGRSYDTLVDYDLTIQTKEDATFDKYASQVNHFLTNINHRNEKQRV